MSKIEEAMQKKAEAEHRGKGRVGEKDTTPQSGVPSRRITPPPPAEKVDEHIVSFHRPRSGLTENFKRIRLVIENMLPEITNKVIMFTSSDGAEGKTTAALNLAAVLAHDTKKRVIVVDADMRHPKMHTLLGMKVRQGFGDLLTSDAPVETVVVETPVPGLSAVLCGEIPPNPSELFGTERCRELFAELKERYDCVVVDTSPVLPVVDTVRVAPCADGVILVVEAAKTSRKKIRQAVQMLNNANASVMGFLLNKGQVVLSDHYAAQYSSGG